MAKGTSSTFPPLDPLSFMDQAPAGPVIAQQSASPNGAVAAMDLDAAAFFADLAPDPESGFDSDAGDEADEGSQVSSVPAAQAKTLSSQAIESQALKGQASRRPSFGGAGRPSFPRKDQADEFDVAGPSGDQSLHSQGPVDRGDAIGRAADAPESLPPVAVQPTPAALESAASAMPFPSAGSSRPSFGARPRVAPPAAAQTVGFDGISSPDEAPASQKEAGNEPVDADADAGRAEVRPPDFSISAIRGRPSFGKKESSEDAPQSYVEPPKGRFADLNPEPSRQVKALRADIKAASIVTELVSAMALHPGSEADTGVKKKALTSILALSRRAAQDLIERIDPERADVGWVKAQALSMTSRMLAEQWAAAGSEVPFDAVRERFEECLQMVNSLLDDESGEVSLCLDAFASGDYYKKVDTAQSATDHRVVSIHLASWEFADAVGSVRDTEGKVFCFGMEPELVVQSLLQKTFEIVSACRPEISDAEAAIAYWRGAMKRATKLIGAEYRSKAAETVKWVDDASGEKRADRIGQSPEIFERQAAPFILEWGMKNFQSIERASKKLIEEASDVQKTSDRHGR